MVSSTHGPRVKIGGKFDHHDDQRNDEHHPDDSGDFDGFVDDAGHSSCLPAEDQVGPEDECFEHVQHDVCGRTAVGLAVVVDGVLAADRHFSGLLDVLRGEDVGQNHVHHQDE